MVKNDKKTNSQAMELKLGWKIYMMSALISFAFTATFNLINNINIDNRINDIRADLLVAGDFATVLNIQEATIYQAQEMLNNADNTDIIIEYISAITLETTERVKHQFSQNFAENRNTAFEVRVGHYTRITFLDPTGTAEPQIIVIPPPIG